MTNRFRISGSVFGKLEELGISPSKMLRQAGMPGALGSEEKLLVTTEEFFAIFRSISELSDDPATGLKLGSEERLERYDPIAIAALCTRSFRDALRGAARYKQLTCPEELQIRETAEECTVRFVWLLAQEDEPKLLVDLCFAWVVGIGRLGTGRLIHPQRIEFARPFENGEMYQQHFQCPDQVRRAAQLDGFSGKGSGCAVSHSECRFAGHGGSTTGSRVEAATC